MASPSTAPVLEVRDLRTHFFTRRGTVRAVDGVSYKVGAGKTLGVVGESGCGKSVAALSILRLVPDPPGRIVGGSVLFSGEDLVRLSTDRMRAIRGNKISMIFQEPMTSLNPLLRIGDQISEPIMLHQGLARRDALDKAVEMLRLVHIPDAERWLRDYPHQMSGGMRQRVMIAMALACNPQVLLADEPTTALDVTIQAQIMRLIGELQDKLGTAVVLITHDLGVVAETAERVVVMYAGRKVEEADVDQLFDRPRHPYTRGLMASIPRLDELAQGRAGRRRLMEIPGIVPSLDRLPEGCAFAPRCAFATERCWRSAPPLEEKASDHWAACWESERVVEEARAAS
ncbi:MAG TPA: ABC transporter ATP-binding protein [Geminicoccaceae bacterium]|nr:ABC transporter ATP-binding protein [Geminicoccaceae bacterium]